MVEKEVQFRVLPVLTDELKACNQSYAEWFMEQATVALVMDDGKIFRKNGDQFLKVSIRDFLPYEEKMDEIKEGDTYEAFAVSAEISELIKDKTENFRTWVLRVNTLGLWRRKMDLYCLDYEGKYVPLTFTSSPPEI